MKWGAVSGITFVVALMAFYEWPRMQPKQKKEKNAFIALAAMGWMLGVLLVLFPDMPSPTDLIEALFKPLAKTIEE